MEVLCVAEGLQAIHGFAITLLPNRYTFQSLILVYWGITLPYALHLHEVHFVRKDCIQHLDKPLLRKYRHCLLQTLMENILQKFYNHALPLKLIELLLHF